VSDWNVHVTDNGDIVETTTKTEVFDDGGDTDEFTGLIKSLVNLTRLAIVANAIVAIVLAARS